MLPAELIRKKRDGETLDASEILAFIGGLTDGGVTDAQAAAFAMAVYFQSMSRDETVALTRAMTLSGRRLTFGGLSGPVLDKHSTGGIGDKVSLILAPILAAAGAFVPMISGRGLGHTGGTLDKLDAILGYVTAPGLDLFEDVVRRVGCAIVGPTADLAPADKRLYAIRDVTATVESAPLIVASILSKKLAAGLDGLVMDVKTGSGAFLPDLDAARYLARTLVEVSTGAGLPCRALLTDMNQCLGRTAGNGLEVAEAIDLLAGRNTEPRLRAVTLELAASLVELGGLADHPAKAMAIVEKALDSGEAAARFARMVAALGGPTDLLERPGLHLQAAPIVRPVHLAQDGFITLIDGRALGLAVIELGGGRKRPEDPIDHRVGLSDVLGRGENTGPDRPFALIHASSEDAADRAARRIRGAVEVSDAQPASLPPPVFERLPGV